MLKISVVVCTYNGEKYLKEQLDSILAQTYPIHEIIVQDDQSTDKTWEILQSYAQQFPQIRIFSNMGLHGINGNFFSAMSKATGDFIAISDQDDIWEKDKLLWQAEGIGNHLLCSGHSVPFSTDGYPIKADMRIPNTHLIRNTYICELPGHSMLFKRELLDWIRGGESLPLYYDWQLLNAAAAAESVLFLPKVLVHFRRHANAATATAPVGGKMLSQSALNYVWTCLAHHGRLQWEVRRRFKTVVPFLQKLPVNTLSLRQALYMGELQLQTSPSAFFKKVRFFLRNRQHLFHATEPRPLVCWLRALFFVFSCGFYYRAYLHLPKNR